MALLDRYLKDVSLWLPRRQAADIVAEVRADIQAEMDDRRESQGRALTVEEEEAILTRWGHPMLVASRYQTQEPLIGPALLPTYYFVLKMVSLLYLLPWLLFWLGLQIVAHSVPSLMPLVVQALVLFALITVGFAVIDRTQRRERKFETWTARELTTPGKSRDWRDKSRSSALFDLVIDIAVLSWWLGLASGPAFLRLDEPALRLTVPSAHWPVYWSVLTLLLASIGMALADLLHPRWTTRRLGLQIGMDVTAAIVGVVLMTYSIVQVIPGADTDLAKSETLVQWVNLSWRVTLGVIAACLVGRVALNISRLGRINSTATAVPAG